MFLRRLPASQHLVLWPAAQHQDYIVKQYQVGWTVKVSRTRGQHNTEFNNYSGTIILDGHVSDKAPDAALHRMMKEQLEYHQEVRNTGQQLR